MKKILILIGVIVALMFIGFAGTYAYLDKYVWSNFLVSTEDTESAKQQIELNKLIEEENGYGKDRPLVYLIGGIDTQDVSSGRTDALMLAVIDSKDKKINLLSIPRDLYVPIEGIGNDKINSAYANGGISLTKKTISNLFDVPIDQYVTVDFNGFKELVDAIGGIEIYVEKNLRYHDRITDTYFELSEGLQTLNGFEALNYARYRKDAEGDYGRMRRQQEVVKQIIAETVDISSVTKLDDIVDALGNNVKTDIKFNDASSLAVKFLGFNSSNFNTIKLDSQPDMIGGISYVTAYESQIEEVKTELHNILSGESNEETTTSYYYSDEELEDYQN